MDEVISFRADQIPQRIRKEASEFIYNYSTVLIYDDEMIGSGTFAKYKSRYGILTAQHVLHCAIESEAFNPNSGKRLGLAIHNRPHAFEIELQYTIFHEVGIPQEKQEYGPDLAFLEILDSNKLGTLKALRSFWALNNESKQTVDHCYKDENSTWAVSGCPYDWKQAEKDDRNFEHVHGFQSLLGFSGIENRFTINEFDYFDIAANYESTDSFPASFGGMSGGGLWKVPIFLRKGSKSVDDLEMTKPLFSGVVFYQTCLENNRRILRSHGAKSVYVILPNIIGKQGHK